MRIHSSLTVEASRGTFGSPRWMEVLAALGSEASIAAAARTVGLSYKGPWGAVGAMLALPLSLIMLTIAYELFPERKTIPHLPG